MKQPIGYIMHGPKMHTVYLDQDSVFILDRVFPAGQFLGAVKTALQGHTAHLSGMRINVSDGIIKFNWAWAHQAMASVMVDELQGAGYGHPTDLEGA